MIKLNIEFLKAVAAVTLQKAVAAITFGHFLIFKELTDSVASVETVTKHINKPTTDTYTVVDTATLTVAKSLAHGFSLSDSAVLSFTAVKSDAIGLSDAQEFATTKVLSDAAFIADATLNFSLTKALSETSFINDERSISVVKPFSNLFLVADFLTTTTNKTLTNSFSASDSGSLRGQGYCDFQYFSDDFTGYSQTI